MSDTHDHGQQWDEKLCDCDGFSVYEPLDQYQEGLWEVLEQANTGLNHPSCLGVMYMVLHLAKVCSSSKLPSFTPNGCKWKNNCGCEQKREQT